MLTLSVFLIAFLFTGCFLFNRTPVIESDPVTTTKEGTVYTYDVESIDPDGDILEFSLLIHPTGMTINPTTGVISWTPASAGSYDVIVEVSDGNKSTIQEFTIIVDETLLTSIEVLPSSMTIEKGSSQIITSITAYYDNGTSANMALNSCTYESNQANVTVTNGKITVSTICAATTAIISVYYTEGETTKSATVNVTVTTPPTGGG